MEIKLSHLQVHVWLIDRLLPYIRNARTHSDEQVAQVAASIAEFGWTNPLLVGSDGMVIAGHARLLAARKLGMTEVPVIVLEHLSETQRRALVLADNRLAMNAGWDEEMLRVELTALDEDGFSLEIVGFTDDELQQLLADPEAGLSAGLTDEDAVPEAAERLRHGAGRCVGPGRPPVALRRFDADGRRRESSCRRPGRSNVDRPSLWRELRRNDEGQTARENAEDRER